ncbi:MAG: M20/M25/M40 family metallo-hydrolase [Eubacteriales bacterium]|nr:M20/M25/M40 family metallo-hydrolase [Eubacteriales bacterium]
MWDHHYFETESIREEITGFLFNLVNISSYSNDEVELANYCFDMFSKIKKLSVSRVPMDNSIKNHPLYCSGMGNEYKNNFNIEVIYKGTGERDPIYLNAHMDTVPAAQGNEHLLAPRMKDGIIYGLGACDDKGGIASIYTVFRMLSESGISLPFDVVGHLVVEEEIGGNGTLAVTNKPMKGQSAIVMEPSGDNIFCSHRAGLWIKISCQGTACHTGSKDAASSVSALDVALCAIDVLKKTHADYVQECRENPVKYYEDYLPYLNVGIVDCGDWPGTVPNTGVVVASIGILPNISTDDMKKRISDAYEKVEMLNKHTAIEYIFDRNSSVLDENDDLVLDLIKAGKKHGRKLIPLAMKAICDKYFYQEIHGIPAVAFGPGKLEDAHSATEQVAIKDVLKVAEILCEYIQMKC